MYFRTHAERMQDPVARHLPTSMWSVDGYFERSYSTLPSSLLLPDDLIPLMTAADDAVLSVLAARPRVDSPDAKARMWLALAFSHPNLSCETLLAACHTLQMSDETCFGVAAALGRMDLFEMLVASYEEQNKLQAMIAADHYRAFRMAASNGHLPIMEYLIAKAPEQQQAMIQADKWIDYGNKYAAFSLAAESGHFHIMEYLARLAPNELQAMVEATDCLAFKSATHHGHLHIMAYLAEKIAPARLRGVITGIGGAIFHVAAQDGHLPVLEYLAEKVPDLLPWLICVYDYAAFRDAAANDQQHVVAYLLRDPGCFGYAEMHMQEYGARYVNPLVTQLMQALREREAAALALNHNAIFDVEAEEARHLFYVLRNLIRRNDPALRDEIVFLLELPHVRELAHRAPSQGLWRGEENELLRLSLAVGNRDAAALLMDIPAVSALAIAHDYYRNERRGELNLRDIARNRESSMVALTEGEQQRLAEAEAHYRPMIEAAGVPQIMADLRDVLAARYEAHPATIEVQDETTGARRTLRLPLTWDAFIALGLTEADEVAARKAYYQHKDHTAWRCLSKPNPFIAQNASYVCVNPGNPRERWSAFESYQALISLFYLAAIDEAIVPTEPGWTPEARLTHFIDELAHIGRAHNWDQTRFKHDRAGNLCVDDEGNPIQEEYDDLTADKPSCHPGFKRRLFQSAPGHPLLRLLTKDMLEDEVRTFVRDYTEERFKKLTQPIQQRVNELWDKLLMSRKLTPEDTAFLKTHFDVSPEEQQDFFAFLQEKYRAQFNDPLYRRYVEQFFTCTENEAHFQTLSFAHQGDFLADFTPAATEQTAASEDEAAPEEETARVKRRRVSEEETLPPSEEEPAHVKRRRVSEEATPPAEEPAHVERRRLHAEAAERRRDALFQRKRERSPSPERTHKPPSSRR